MSIARNQDTPARAAARAETVIHEAERDVRLTARALDHAQRRSNAADVTRLTGELETARERLRLVRSSTSTT